MTYRFGKTNVSKRNLVKAAQFRYFYRLLYVLTNAKAEVLRIHHSKRRNSIKLFNFFTKLRDRFSEMFWKKGQHYL